MDFKAILKRLNELYALDRKNQEALEQYVKVIAAGSYTPVRENTLAGGFIEGVGQINPELKDWLEYYTYEAKNMDEAIVRDGDDKWDFTKDDEVVDFLNKTFNV